MAGRPTFSGAQLNEYFDRIRLPTRYRQLCVTGLSGQEQLAYLARLKSHHLVAIPFENLTLHYSWHRVVDVDPQHLFTKVVQQPGRGGYCMEVNSLLHIVLLSLGFSVFMVGSRVYDQELRKYDGFTHCVNIVTISGAQYMVDVGFGANGPSEPIKLEAGAVRKHIAPASMRLQYESIPQNLNQTCKLWIYQHRFSESAPWVPIYCFVDFEFLLDDIRCMNLAPWRSPSSFFTQKVVIARFTAAGEADGGSKVPESHNHDTLDVEIDGTVSIDHDKLKWRRNGVTVVEKQFKNDAERVQALAQYFGITLQKQDRDAIGGTVAEVKA